MKRPRPGPVVHAFTLREGMLFLADRRLQQRCAIIMLVAVRVFVCILDYLIAHPQMRAAMGQNGIRYVNENYQWPVIVDKFARLIDMISPTV